MDEEQPESKVSRVVGEYAVCVAEDPGLMLARLEVAALEHELHLLEIAQLSEEEKKPTKPRTPTEIADEYMNLPLEFFARDEYTGEVLDPAEVRESRGLESRQWAEFEVYDETPDAGLRRHKKVGMRWIDHMKHTDDGS